LVIVRPECVKMVIEVKTTIPNEGLVGIKEKFGIITQLNRNIVPFLFIFYTNWTDENIKKDLNPYLFIKIAKYFDRDELVEGQIQKFIDILDRVLTGKILK